MVEGVRVQVMKIEQDAAAGPAAELVQELLFRELLLRIREVVHVVLQEEGAAPALRKKTQTRDQQVENFLVVGYGQRNGRIHLVSGSDARKR